VDDIKIIVIVEVTLIEWPERPSWLESRDAVGFII